MHASGKIAVKVILVLGLLAFAGLYFASVALKHGLQPDARERVILTRSLSPFDHRRAMRDLETMLAFGPRPSNSDANASVRRWLSSQLRAAGFPVREHAFEADTPQGHISMTNLIAASRGGRPGATAIITHYDTMPVTDFVFIGANASGAGAVWLLEMARAIGPECKGRSLWYIWCDGHEWPDGKGRDGLYGSRALVADLEARGELGQLAAAIAVSRIGDYYLGIAQDPAAPAWLRELVWDVARDQGHGQHFRAAAYAFRDDHIPFRDAGIPCLALIDFSFGGSRLEHDRYWRTAGDTQDRVCGESLQAVADVLYHALPSIDGRPEAGPEG
ncbi:MAG: M28 family peptidase [Candidatus Hydrogenedentes bacterium]|nr:M28 family peptidase [Candidatus Hydrogenedentota bacterium]